ncbi:hypothetical protein VPH35_020788 [Triticum aestivum]
MPRNRRPSTKSTGSTDTGSCAAAKEADPPLVLDPSSNTEVAVRSTVCKLQFSGVLAPPRAYLPSPALIRLQGGRICPNGARHGHYLPPARPSPSSRAQSLPRLFSAAAYLAWLSPAAVAPIR